MYVDNDIKEMPLLKIVFLELKKYQPELKESYNKVRWLEFFGNKQYTSEPGEIIDQADDLLNVRNWTKEEQRMYDEITRQQDHYWASLAYAQEEGRAEGRAEGREEGRAEGIEEAIITLMKNGHISLEVAAAQLKLNIEELNKYL